MIIDARLRPAYKGFLQQFNAESNRKFSAKFGMTSPESVQQASEKLMLEEMDRAGIKYAVATGRKGHFRYNISNDDLVDMVEHFKGRFIGMAGIDASMRGAALEEIKRYVVNGPLTGTNLETGAMPEPWYANDRRIYPVYELCEEHNIPVILMLGGRAGPDVSFSNPTIISQIARDFPKVRFMLSHGGWPWVPQILCTVLWQPENIYLCPDLYLHAAGGKAFAEAVRMIPERIIYGSAYPLMPIEESLQKFRELVEPQYLENVLYKNAAGFLGLDLK